MSDLGQLLKEARIDKGIDLDQLQDSTKIQKRYLEAIEQGQFSVLPGNFYVRAFIKSYAEAVGLNPDEVLHLYKDVIPSTSSSQADPIRKKNKRRISTDRLSKWVSTALVWIFPIIIAVFIYIYFTQFHEPKPSADNDYKLTEDYEPVEQPEEVIPDDEDIVDDEPLPIEEEPPLEPEVEYVVTDGAMYIYNVSNAEKLKLELSMTGDRCWVLVKRDNKGGETLLETTLLKDEVEVWEVEHSMHIRMGNPSTVEVRINDVLIDREMLQFSNPWEVQVNFVTDTELDGELEDELGDELEDAPL